MYFLLLMYIFYVIFMYFLMYRVIFFVYVFLVYFLMYFIPRRYVVRVVGVTQNRWARQNLSNHREQQAVSGIFNQ